ncbi:tetratricopeptide repeat protein [Fulvivirga sedimenti]|uniref:Tetratricopeptide repeat protein n=1 Tax=Fulvivirga sedimenti TaxID=2879465 RepID=A0A9X1KZV2_9BACT|nr:tetratricopeptide repeat protein [Fulvivirga sedimenti]MCA6078710.1 tetratricopeptide repeat protein [Fulvivirga sedimenti]
MTSLFTVIIIMAAGVLSNPNEKAGDAHYSNRNIPEAIHYYTEALREDPDSAIVYYKRARAYLINHQYENYNRDIARALELDPDLPKKLSNPDLTVNVEIE